MNRMVLVVAVSAAMTGLGYCCFEDAGAGSPSMYEIEVTKRRLDADFERMHQFRKLLDQVLCELGEDDMKLAQAVDRIEEAANGYYPIYLEKLTLPKRAASPRERIAHNLVRHFAALMDDCRGDTTQMNAALCRIRQELATMFPPVPEEL